jgi:hypothetical protein
VQLSVYLREDLVKEVDRLARRQRKSRSKVIEGLVEASLEKTGRGRLLDLVGSWKDDRPAAEIIKEIYGHRRRNRRSDRWVS